MGNTVVRKYLMTTGYLWTDQFPESSLPVNEGRPQSMEFKPETLKGNWQKNYENGLDFFIINDAIIQKICILGDDVEPCFEGASVTAPDVSTKFTLDDNFRHTLYSMMQDLKKDVALMRLLGLKRKTISGIIFIQNFIVIIFGVIIAFVITRIGLMFANNITATMGIVMNYTKIYSGEYIAILGVIVISLLPTIFSLIKMFRSDLGNEN